MSSCCCDRQFLALFCECSCCFSLSRSGSELAFSSGCSNDRKHHRILCKKSSSICMWKKKASCNFVFFTCPCKENEIIISSEIDSSLKKLLTSRKRITSHNRGPQIIIILLKHSFHYKYRWESKVGLHKSFWYCKEFDALIFYFFFMNTFLLPFKFLNFIFNILIN